MYSESDPDPIRFQSNDRRNYSVSNNEYHDTDITNRNNSNTEKKELLCMYACEVRLPAGRYLSEMDGSIFVISDFRLRCIDDKDAAVHFTKISSCRQTYFTGVHTQ